MRITIQSRMRISCKNEKASPPSNVSDDAGLYGSKFTSVHPG